MLIINKAFYQFTTYRGLNNKTKTIYTYWSFF